MHASGAPLPTLGMHDPGSWGRPHFKRAWLTQHSAEKQGGVIYSRFLGWSLVQVSRGQRGRAELVVDAVERGVESTGAAVGIEEWQLPTFHGERLR